MPVGATNISGFSGPFLPNGVTVTFPFTFTAPTAAEVTAELHLPGLAPTAATGFTVTVNPAGGGSITFAIAPAAGSTLYILLSPRFDQPIGFANGAPWRAEPVNEVADRGALRDQALRRELMQSVRMPLGSPPVTFDSPVGQTGKFPVLTADGRLGWASGTGSDPALRTDLASDGAGALIKSRGPGIGSSLIFGTLDAKMRRDIDLSDGPFNMRPGADADQGVKLSELADAWKQAGGERRKATMPAGKLKVSETGDLTGISSGFFGQMETGDNRGLIIEGAGRDQTVLVGGEPEFGFMEVTDSCNLILRGFSIDAPNSGGAQASYGIIGGRTTGNGSSGLVTLDRIGVRGRFTKWAIFFLSNENTELLNPVVWTTLGNNIGLGMNNTNHNIVPKHLPFGTGLGGNGVNKVVSPWLASLTQAGPDSCLLMAEFTQNLIVENFYGISSHSKSHIRLGKRAKMKLDGAHFEYDPSGATVAGSQDPISIEFMGGTGVFDPTYDIGEYRGSSLSNMDGRSVYAHPGSQIVGLIIDESCTLKSFHQGYAMNFATLEDSRIMVSNKLLDPSAVASRTDIKIRTANGGNTYGPGIKREMVVAPIPSLDTFLAAETGRLAGTTGLSTIPGAAVGGSGMFASIAAPGTNSFAVMVDMIVPDISDFNERCLFAIGTGPTDMGVIGSASLCLYAGQLIARHFGDAGGQIDYRGSTDTGFVAKTRFKRVRIMLRRFAGETVPRINMDGGLVQIGRTSGVGAGLWNKAVTGTWLLIGHQNATAANNCPTIYHEVSYWNYAPTDVEANRITLEGVRASDRWGGGFGVWPPGCIGLWDMAAGGGARVLEASATSLVTDGNIVGTTARFQDIATPPETQIAGSPVGARFPRWDREIVQNTVTKTRYQAIGLGLNDWMPDRSVVQSRAGTPIGFLTPEFLYQRAYDTVAPDEYYAFGLGINDWKKTS